MGNRQCLASSLLLSQNKSTSKKVHLLWFASTYFGLQFWRFLLDSIVPLVLGLQ